MIGELTNHLWQSTLFAVAAGLLTLAFRKNRAGVRYALWLTASVKFLIPFSLLMSLGSRVEFKPVAHAIASPAVSFTVMEIAQPYRETSPIVAAKARVDWARVAMWGAWVCGFAAIAIMRLRAWNRVRDAVRAGTRLEIPGLKIEIRASPPGLLEPGVVGILSPMLLLPAGILERLTPAQFDAVLAHEMSHVRRRDNLTSAIHMMVEAMFWFHPLVWWISARLIDERERACDEEVLRLGNESHVYAEGILNVCKSYLESPLSCVSGITGSDLKKRIQAIMTQGIVRELSLGKKGALVVAGIAAVAAPVVVGLMHGTLVRAQSASGLPKFEAASIKPCQDAGSPNSVGRPASLPGRLTWNCAGVKELILSAYATFADGHHDLSRSREPIVGGPSWINSERYSINAKAEESRSQAIVRGPMLQALLEDRFKLKVHRENREAPVYELRVAKRGPKLQPFKEGSCIPNDYTIFPRTRPAPDENRCHGFNRPKGPNIVVDAQGTTVEEFSKIFLGMMDRPVINKTGITGRFDFRLEYTRDEVSFTDGPPMEPSDEPVAASIFTAIQEQLGLKLIPAKGPREFLVIDHVERPSEN
jgi:bla regulator protein BlaR1